MEGYFDFAQVYQTSGMPVVATCGTALTTPQAVMLRRFASKAVLCFDPDAAGQSAAERSCELLVGEGFDVNVDAAARRRRSRYICTAPWARGIRSGASAIAPVSGFPARERGSRPRPFRDDSRREFLQKMLAVAARIPDPATRDQFADRLAHKARVTEEVVRAEIRKAAGAKKTVSL